MVCRLAKGLGLAPNCAAEEVFIYVVLKDAFELGWRRIAEHVDPLPETDKDRDYGRIHRLLGFDDISTLYRTDPDAKLVVSSSASVKPTKESKKTDSRSTKVQTNFNDFRNWFRAYDKVNIHDHDIVIEEDEESA